MTNSAALLLELPQGNDWSVISTGGRYCAEGMYFYGNAGEDVVRKYNVDYAILSCKGLDMERGVTDTREPVADLKKAFLGAAKAFRWLLRPSRTVSSAV